MPHGLCKHLFLRYIMRESQKSELLKIFMSGDLYAAKAKVAELSTKEQNTGFVQNFLGVVSLQQGRIIEAIELFDKAVRLDFEYPAPLKNLALSYLQLNELEPALSNINRALSLVPDDPDALHTRGFLKLRADKFFDAIVDLEKCISIATENSKFLNTAGMAYFGVDDLLIAKKYFKKAAKLLPDSKDAILSLARCERQLGNYSESDRLFVEVLETQPKNITALMGLAVNLLNQGKAVAARTHLVKCTDISPTNGAAYNLLAEIDKTLVNDKLFIRMQQIVEKTTSLSKDDSMQLRHALYKSFERSGDFKNAFHNLKLANDHQVRKRQSIGKVPYQLEQDYELFETISALEERFPKSDFRHGRAQQPAPIFIVGLPRSGTSLVEQIVNNHPHVQAVGELTYLQNSIERTGMLTATPDASIFSDVRKEYFSKTLQHSLDGAYFIDKMPLNFRWLGVIIRSIPEAKIIHMYRQPQATCFSIYSNIFSGNLGFDNKMSDIAAYYNLYSSLMNIWHKKYHNKIFHLNYDHFVENPRELSMKLFDYLNLDWTPAFIETKDSSGAVATASRMQVRRSIYKGSSEFWKQYEFYIDKSILELDAFDPDTL